MRILHINLAKRGIGRYGLLYGRALAGLDGVEAFSVFDSQLFDGSFLRGEIGSVEHASIEWSHPNKVRRLIEMSRIAAKFQPDIIHDSGGCYARSLPLWLALRRFAPLVITEHDPVPHVGRRPSFAERLARAMMPRLMSHIFVHGPHCEQMLIDRGLPAKNISVIRHGHLGMFDRGAFSHANPSDRNVLFFGELRYNKGADLLVEIADYVVSKVPDVKFIVAGSSEAARRENAFDVDKMKAEMVRRTSFEVHDRFIPDEEVEYFFKRCAITVLPYREATQSGIAMIAMPLGSVIVATQVGDIPDVVRDGETGCLADPDIESIGSQIIDLFRDPRKISTISNAARKYVFRECSWEASAAHVVRQCESIAQLRITS